MADVTSRDTTDRTTDGPPGEAEEQPWFEGHPVVFPASAGIMLLFVLLAVLWPGRTLMAFNWLQGNISRYFAWLYTASMSFFLVFAVWLGFGRFGAIKLGGDDEEPEFSTLAWFSMLFSAGMGIGMLFFGVAEPMWHYLSPPVGEAQTLQAARQAMGITLFHWCLHPWGLYAVVGLALAYFGFRRDLPLSFRSVFEPILGARIHGWPGHLIDTLAVCATLFGLATSLGLGAKQINAGLYFVFGLPQSTTVQLGLIACITCAAVASLVSGLDAGIRRLSEINMCLAAGLLVFVLSLGPTRYLLGATVENVGVYLTSIPSRSFWTATYQSTGQATWFGNWTVFYWGWWIAWSPFVGMFIARISRGRTIREFVLGVLLVPSLVAILWMSVFGNGAIHQEIVDDLGATASTVVYREHPYPVQVLDEIHGLPFAEEVPTGEAGVEWMVARGGLVRDDGQGNLVSRGGVPLEQRLGVWVDRRTGEPFEAEEFYAGRYRAITRVLGLGGFLSEPVLNAEQTTRLDTTATCMFVMLAAYPLAWLSALIATFSIILFFVTSSDSASLVADIIASGGNQNPPTGTRIFWGTLEGLLAGILLVAGGLKALQTGSITIGLPFCVLILGMCWSLRLGLEQDLATEGIPVGPADLSVVDEEAVPKLDPSDAKATPP